jgi:hypothetical protein
MAMPEERPMLDVLADLRAEGYEADFSAAPDGLRCGACQEVHDPEQARIDRVARFEGASDPGDETILLALTCVHCGLRGVLVAAYGPAVGPDEADVLRRLDTRPR